MGVKLNPHQSLTWYRRGLVYSQMNDCVKAIQDLTKAVELDKNYGDAYFQRAICFKKTGRGEDAAGDLAKGVTARPRPGETGHLKRQTGYRQQ